MAPVRATFKTASGRDFPVEWDNEGLANKAWGWNESHFPQVLTPVFAWIHGDVAPQEATYTDVGVEPFSPMRGRLVPHGFQYTRQTPLDADELGPFMAKAAALGAKFGGANRVWEAFCQPRTEAAVRALNGAALKTPVAELSRLYHTAIHNTHIGGMVALGPINGPLQAILGSLFPPAEAALLSMEVGQGGDSATMESNRAIAAMAAIARSTPAVSRIVSAGGDEALPALREESAAKEFMAAFNSYIDRYRLRASGWDITDPTLGEQPEMALGMVQQAMAARDDDATARDQVLRRRDEAIARVEAKIGGDTAEIERFRALAGQLENYTAIREGRALWQLMTSGSLRLALLRKGEAMMHGGVIDAAGDIFYLVPREIDQFFEANASGSLRDVVLHRRREWESWLGDKPPLVVSANSARLPGSPPATDENVVRGVPGSRGTLTATARVVLDFDAADELKPGEVLVCVMTTPPWTPLFGVASAIVTDSGLALSHPAIAAREYGIPCVVGAAGATSRIRTGDTITVDGDAGTVTIVSRAS